MLSGGNTTDICIYHLFHGGNLYQKYEKKVNTNIKRHISPFEHRINYFITNPNKDKIFFILHQKLDYVDLWNVNMNNQINTFVAKIYKSKKVEGNIISSNKIIYTGALDEYYDCKLGKLEYRSLRFDTKVMDIENFQGNAVVNYTGHEVDYTRVIEHKHFEFVRDNPQTVVTYEYPADYKDGMERYYTVNDDKNNDLANQYRALASQEKNVVFGGRLAEYKYYDMDDVIKSAFEAINIEDMEINK